MRRIPRRLRFAQAMSILAFLFVASLLTTLGYRLTPPGGAPSVRARFGLARRQVAVDANLVLITIDGLRPAHLGVYGAPLPSATPRLDHLAREGFRFEQAVSPAPSSLAAHAALLSGLLPSATGVVSPLAGPFPPGRLTLAEILRPAGFRTAAFLGSGALGRWTGLARGFDRFDELNCADLPATLRPFAGRPAAQVIDAARLWIDENFRGRFFLWVQLSDPLPPHNPPAAFDRLFRDPYDAAIASADAELGRLLGRLSSLGVLGHTIVAVSAPYGLGLGEHAERLAGSYLYDSTTLVPLLLWVPGVAAHERSIPEQVRLIDLLPTVLDLLHIGAPAGLAGTSLVPLLDPEGGLPALPAVSQAELLHDYLEGPPLRALREAGWKFVEGPTPELYDLHRDPAEASNLAGSLAGKVAEMRETLASIAGPPQVMPNAMSSIPPRAVALLEDAEQALQGGEGNRAARILDALRTLPGWPGGAPPPALAALMGAAQKLQGRLGEALQICEQAVAQMDAAGTASAREAGLRGLLHAEIGAGRRLSGDVEGAIEAYKEAARLLPDDPDLLAALAAVYLETGPIGEAITSYRAALARAPGNPRILAGLGRAYLDGGEPLAAIETLQEAIRAAPSAPRPYFDLGRACESLKRPTEAARAYREFLERAPVDDASRRIAADRLRVLEGSGS